MIRIEDFLFRENIDRSLSESLLSKYPNLSFETVGEFYDYFDSKGIALIKDSSSVTTEKQTLLQRFKDFKTSPDYASVKKYIAEQKKIQSLIENNSIDEATSILESIERKTVDPFFNFVVRRVLTGSDTGILPSEKLKDVLDNIVAQKKGDIDIGADVVRDHDGTIQSYRNYLKNVGTLKVNLLDERFLIDSYDYVVDRNFEQIRDAVNAETNVLKKIEQLSGLPVDSESLEQSLSELILKDSTSVPVMMNKIEKLQERLDNMQETLDLKDDTLGDLTRVIEELSDQRNKLVDEIGAKDQTILELNNTITITLEALEQKVLDQLENGGNAFEDLSKRLEEQAAKAEADRKRAEENANKQLEAFKSAMSGLVSSINQNNDKQNVSDSDSPEEKERKENINSVLDNMKKILVFTDKIQGDFFSILSELNIPQPNQSAFVVRLPFSKNDMPAGREAKRILAWSQQYAPQYRSYISQINELEQSKKVKTLMDKIVKDGTIGIDSLKEYLYNAFNEWYYETETRKLRGAAYNGVKNAIRELGLEPPREPSSKILAQAKEKVKNTDDASTLMRAIYELSTISNNEWN